LLAEFMAYVIDPDFKETLMIRAESGSLFGYHPSTDWNDLMRVVEKIESTDNWRYAVSVCQTDCIIEITESGSLSDLVQVTGENKIDAVYKACVEFVKWYNENKKSWP